MIDHTQDANRSEAASDFDEHRGLLVSVAYRILGSVTDAEDAVQEAWIRWSGVDHSEVSDPLAFLVRVTTRLAIDRLRRAKARRESYVGPWLPEPILTRQDPAEDAAMAESVSMAMLVVLETLSPLERAVFVLREAFGMPHAEVPGCHRGRGANGQVLEVRRVWAIQPGERPSGTGQRRDRRRHHRRGRADLGTRHGRIGRSGADHSSGGEPREAGRRPGSRAASMKRSRGLEARLRKTSPPDASSSGGASPKAS